MSSVTVIPVIITHNCQYNNNGYSTHRIVIPNNYYYKDYEITSNESNCLWGITGIIESNCQYYYFDKKNNDSINYPINKDNIVEITLFSKYTEEALH